MIEEKRITVKGKEFVISKLPATVGREVLFKYGTSNIPKVGNYATSEEIMLKLMQYVGVYVDGRLIELKTQELVNNHVPDATTLILLEKEMMSYNFDFFTKEKTSAFFAQLNKLVEQRGTEILTALLDKLSPKVKQRFKS